MILAKFCITDYDVVDVSCEQLFNCTDKCPDELPHKATDTTSDQPETICIAEPIVYELVVTVVYLNVVIHHHLHGQFELAVGH